MKTFALRATLVLLSAALLLASCGRDKPQDPEPQALPPQTGISGLYIRGGNLVSFSDFSQIPAKDFLPWTVQERISGFLEVDGSLYIVMNSLGFLVSDSASDVLSFRSIKNLPLFSGRSAGIPYLIDGRIYCHLSWNTTFKTPKPAGKPAALAFYEPGATDIAPFIPPFQEKHPGWEAVELFVAGDGRIYTAWKSTEKEKTQFSYTAYKLGDGYEKEMDRAAFLKGYGFVDLASAPEAIKAIHALNLFPQSEVLVVHYVVRGSGGAGIEYFRAGDFSLIESGKADLRTVSVLKNGDYYALFPQGKLARIGERSEVFELPELPKAYTYTDFWTNGKTAYLAFEEQKFVGVGNAGFLFFPLVKGL